MILNISIKKAIGLFSAVLVRGFGSLASVAITVLISFHFDANDTGVLLLGFSVVFFLGQLSTFGSQNSVIKKLNSFNQKSNKNAYITKIVFFVNCISFAFMFTIWVVFSFIANVSNSFYVLYQWYYIIAASTVLFANTQLLGFIIQALNKPVYASFFHSFLTPALFSFCFLMFIHYRVDVHVSDVFYIYAFCNCFTIAIALIFLFRFNIRFSLHLGDVSLDIKNSLLPLAVVLAMNLIVTYASHFIAGIFLPSKDVGLLVLSQRISMAVSFILIAINLIIAPRIANAHYKNDISYIMKVCALARWVILFCATPIVFLICFFAENLLLLFDVEYVGQGHILVILALSQLINVLTGSVGFVLALTSHERELRTISLITGLISLFSCVFLTWTSGLLGASIGVFLSVLVQNSYGVYMVKQKLNINMIDYSLSGLKRILFRNTKPLKKSLYK